MTPICTPRCRGFAANHRSASPVALGAGESGFTLLFEALAMVLILGEPVRAAAKILGEDDTRLWR
jgi:hypothetical protein